MEGLTKAYVVGMVVDEAARAELEEAFLLRQLDRVRVLGRTEPLTIYEPLRPREDADARPFGELAEAHPADPVYPLFLQRMAETDPEAEFPADWDGIFRHGSKQFQPGSNRGRRRGHRERQRPTIIPGSRATKERGVVVADNTDRRGNQKSEKLRTVGLTREP